MFKFLSRLGDSNEREVRALEPLVERITALEPEIQALSDDELRGRTAVLRERLRERVGDILVPIELRSHSAEEDAADSARSSCRRPSPRSARPWSGRSASGTTTSS